MNHYADDRSAEHADDAQRLLERLRQVGEAGITTGELIREGCCGLRPPNRIGDLPRQGHEIKTIREENGVFRFVLVREKPNPQPRSKGNKPSDSAAEPCPETAARHPWGNAFSENRLAQEDGYVKQTGRPHPSGKLEGRVADLPLFATKEERE